MQNGTTNGVHKDPTVISEHELIWDGLSPAVIKALDQPLDPALMSQRKGRAGRTYDYIEGHVVIDQANRIFGHGGWGYELVGDVTLRRIETVDSKTGEVRVSHAYSAPVRVTVSGAQPRTDVGFHAVAEETPEGHGTALKGAVTDGMKRALRSFGVQFGNGLYGNPSTSPAPARVGGEPRPQVKDAMASPKGEGQGDQYDQAHLLTLRKRLIDLGAEQGFDEEKVRAAVKSRTGRDLQELTIAELDPLVAAAARKVLEIQKARESEGQKAA